MWARLTTALTIAALIETVAANGVRKKLPKVSSKGMMKWKKWWWNDVDGMRQCDDPYGCNDKEDPGEKVADIKKRWKVDTDDELLPYMRRVREHARTHTWREQGHVYSFCTKYQGDLQEVLDYLELKHERALRAAKRAQKAKGSATGSAPKVPPATKAAKAQIETSSAMNPQEARDEDVEERPAVIKSDAKSKLDSQSSGSTNFHEARDKLESVDTWEQVKSTSMDASSWVVLALSTLWSYATGWLRFGSSSGGVQKDL